MIDFKCYRLAASWRRWSVNQYVLSAWVRNSSLTINFLQTPELYSVGTKTDIYLIMLITHQKNLSGHKKLEKESARKTLKFVQAE